MKRHKRKSRATLIQFGQNKRLEEVTNNLSVYSQRIELLKLLHLTRLCLFEFSCMVVSLPTGRQAPLTI